MSTSPKPPNPPPAASPPPPTSQSPTSVPEPATSPTRHDLSADPKVAGLQIMFPAIEPGVIGLILESCGGSQDRAIEQLLSMTDPEYKPDESSLGHEEASQLDLDAQFARSLQMQDQEESRQGGRALPYQPRVRRRAPPGQGQGDVYGDGYYNPPGPNQPNPPGMMAMEDRLNQYAEVGKQTVSSLFNKAKAKYNDFQATQASNAANREEVNRSNQPWRRPSPGPEWTPTPGGGRGGEQNRSKGLWGDESSRSTSFSEDTEAQGGQPKPAARWQPSDAYDDPLPHVPLAGQTASSNRIDVAGGRRSPASIPAPGADKTPPTNRIDPAKLGFLPKKRVDLMSTSPSPPGKTINKASTGRLIDGDDENEDEDDPNPGIPAAPRSIVSQIPKTPPAGHDPYSLGDSDDDLEYTKSPFDER